MTTTTEQNSQSVQHSIMIKMNGAGFNGVIRQKRDCDNVSFPLSYILAVLECHCVSTLIIFGATTTFVSPFVSIVSRG